MMINLNKHRILLGLLFIALSTNLSFWQFEEAGSIDMASKEARIESMKSIKAQLRKCLKEDSRTCEFDAKYADTKKKTDFERAFEIRVIEEEQDLLEEYRTEAGRMLPGDRRDREEKIRSICKIDKDAEADIQKVIDNCDGEAKTMVFRTEYKVKDCNNCDWTELVPGEEFERIEDIARKIKAALMKEGEDALDKYKEEKIIAEKKENCKINDDEEDITGMNRVEERLTCIWEKDVDSESSLAKRRDAYEKGIKGVLAELLRSPDPRLRQQGRALLKTFWSESYDLGHGSLAAEMDAMMIQSQAMEGLLNVTMNCLQGGGAGGQMLPGPQNQGYFNGGQQFGNSFGGQFGGSQFFGGGVHGSAPTSCMIRGLQHVQHDMVQKTFGLSRAYKTVGRTDSMFLARQFSQIYGQEANQAIQNPQGYIESRYRSVFDSGLGSLGGMSAITNGNGLANMALGSNGQFMRNPGNGISMNPGNFMNNGLDTSIGAFRGGNTLPGLNTIPQMGTPFGNNALGMQNTMFSGAPNNLAGAMYGAQQNPMLMNGQQNMAFGSTNPMLLGGPGNMNMNVNPNQRNFASQQQPWLAL